MFQSKYVRVIIVMDAYILVKGIISIAAQERDKPNNGDEEVVLESYAPFTDYIS